ncbi:hypothetical protein [Mycobacteroides saopaulense]|uniref:Uncharacterized protein n=1 Tax=Mycobacteroides saopaulense TaxID=1578165 RepID=A0ABX3BXC0_9MYCO|nr:hypothetical protein [Mycobacteroides saopaulense]OHT86541.1 hypothetical protein BKG68_10320 [Mycobacteroides saopaulense]OHU08400.1 hypothetical protein BKG73_15010 [Mycobacteroides saopaulense]
MVETIRIRIDVGSAAPLDLVAKLIHDVSTVSNVALALDRQSELNRATRLMPLDEPARIDLIEYLQTRRYRPYDYPDEKQYGLYGRMQDILERLFLSSAVHGPPGLWPPAEAQAAYLLDALPDSGPLVPTVEEISYRNPLEIVLSGFTWGHLALSGATGGSLLALLNFVAYLGPKRDKLKAEAEKTRAEARKINAEVEEIQGRTNQTRTESELKAELYRTLLRRVQDGNAVLTPQQINDIVDDKAIGAIVELTQRPFEIEHRPDDKAS